MRNWLRFSEEANAWGQAHLEEVIEDTQGEVQWPGTVSPPSGRDHELQPYGSAS